MPRIKMKADQYAAADFQKAVRIGRAALGIRQCALAERMGMAPSTLSDKLSNPERLTAVDLRKLFRAGVVSETDLIKFIRGDLK